MHGEKVAYGIFYQLALEINGMCDWELIPYYEELNLLNLYIIRGIYPEDETVIDDVVRFVDSKANYLLPIEINFKLFKEKLLEQKNIFPNK